MISQEERKKIEEIAEEFFNKTTVLVLEINASLSSAEFNDVVDLNINLDEPQILIGQGGQTLFEIQRILRMILNKKLQKIFYLNLDINGYKKQKTEYLKEVAKNMADEVALTKNEKILQPMPSYERRIIHAELAQRTDVATESAGEGQDRHIVIKPK
jgi:spoIIIJ-associated protein